MDADFPVGMLECIEEFLAEDSTRPAGLDICPEVFATSLFFPLQRMKETEQMVAVARGVAPRTIYEIGADKGGSLYHWCKCFPSVRRVAACEIRGLPYAKLFEKAFHHIDFLWLHGSSTDPSNLEKLRDWALKDNQKLDVVFIDGDKGTFALDFWSVYSVLSTSSVVFMHDVVDPPMKDEFEKLGSLFSTRLIHDVSEVAELINCGYAYSSLTPYQNWLLEWGGRSCGVGVIDTGVRYRPTTRKEL